MIRFFIILFLSIFISSCILAPGMEMPSPPIANSEIGEIKPRYIPINTQLIRHFQQRHNALNHPYYRYRVDAEDILSIYVWDHPEFNASLGQAVSEQGINANLHPTLSGAGYLVGPTGHIYFPMAGEVYVKGKTVEEIRQHLNLKLSRYIRHPQAEVRVIGFRSQKIYVMGEVKKPGLQPITDAPLSITEAINLAGGFDVNSADPSHIFVIRGDYQCPEVYWLNARSPYALLLAENFYLLPHDVVFISATAISRWNRAISLILPTIQTIWFTDNLIRSS